jgi:CHAT domain-containing protein/tetratricopeptide (TPR) repeat protein
MRLYHIALTALVALCSVASTRAERIPLLTGRRIGSVCSPNSPRYFLVKLQAATSLRIIVGQEEADLTIRILATKGRPSRVIDAFDFSAETVTIVAPTTSEYRLEILPVRKDAGLSHFTIHTEAVHRAGPLDQQWVDAEQLATDSKEKALDRQAWEEALQLTNRSLEAWQSLGQTSLVARTRLRAGDVYFAHGIRDLAHQEYLAAAQLCESDRCRAEGINNAGTASLNLFDLQTAESELQAALAIWVRLGNAKMAGITHSNLGVVFTRQSAWRAALHEYDLAGRLLKARDPLRFAVVLSSIGLIHMSVFSYAQAEHDFLEAWEIASRYPESPTIQGRIRINLGRSRMLTNQLDLALQDEIAALAIMEKNADPGIGDALNNVGQIQLRMGDLAEAARVLTRAAESTKSDPRSHSSALHFLGVAAYRQGDVETARTFLNQALAIRHRRAMRNEEAETLYQLAILERDANQREESLRDIREAIRLSEEIRRQLSGEPLRRFSAGRYPYSEFYVDAMLFGADRAHYESFTGAAFNASERARAQAQAELLGEDVSTLRDADPVLLKRRSAVQRRFQALSYRLATLPERPDTQALASKLRGEIDSALAESRDLELLIRAENPAYKESVDPRLVTAEEVRADLKAGDYLLEYALGEERGFLWIVTREQIRTEILPSRVEIEKKARDLMEAFPKAAERRKSAAERADWLKRRLELAQALHLNFTPDVLPKRMIIVPDGALHYVPWAVLPLLRGSPAVPEDPMGLRYEVVQVPSASVFHIMEGRRRSAASPTSVAVIADPVYQSLDSRVEQRGLASEPARTKAAGMPLVRLTRWMIAAEPLRRRVPANRLKIFDSFQASKGAFFRRDVLQSSILMLWTHGVADRPAELSRIVLTMVNRHGQPLDGLIHLPDLFGVRMNSSLVILAACEGSGGPSERGDAVLGLARGFLQAGVAGLMTTAQASLDEESTAYLLKYFFDALLSDPASSPPRALLLARRAIAGNERWHADEYYWGSLGLISGVS